MVRLHGIVPLILFAALVCGCGRTVESAPQEEIPSDYDAGTLRMYPFREVAREQPPKGWKPFMLSHYGRHGARFHGDDTQGLKVYSALCEGPLTPLGEELRGYIGLYYGRFEGHRSDLTEKGRMQHRELAHRMWDAYPALFKARPEISAVSTTAPRCILSMGAFCDGLRDRSPGLWVPQSASSAYDSFLQPQKLIPGFINREKQAWQVAREFCAETIRPRAFIGRIFGDSLYRVASYPSEVSFMRNVHYLLCNATAMDVELPPAPEVFTPEERFSLWEGDNLKYYLNYGYFRGDSTGVRAAGAMLADIILRAEEDIAAGKPTVRLRFGHDANLMSLLALLGVPEFAGVESGLHKVKDVWQEWRIPFAANLQFVFFRHPRKDNILVQVLLNEEPVRLPLAPGKASPGLPGGPASSFYRWDDLSAFCHSLMD